MLAGCGDLFGRIHQLVRKLGEELSMLDPHLLVDKQVSRVFFWCQNTLSWQADLNFMAFPVWMTCEMIPATRGVLESLCARCLMQQRVGMHPDVVSTERLGPLGFKILTKSQTENCCLYWCETGGVLS